MKNMTVRERAQKDPQGLIGRAFAFAKQAHEGQRRKSGEPYINHSLETAEALSKWRLDDDAIVAGLLHDVVEDTKITREEVVKNFGEHIAFLVDGVTKLSHVKYRGAAAKIENLRKMILALSQDLRVIFIKLADRLHNMKTIQALPPQKQKRIALETTEIYAPIAHRLGMHELAGTLQDLAFPILHPEESRWLKSQVAAEYESRHKYLERVKPQLEEILTQTGTLPFNIDFRAKHYYSLYRKMQRYEMDITRIYDLVAMRIILPSIQDCYAALGAIHNAWPPLPGRIKDYIAMPKSNNYRSLHTTVIGPEGRYIEIQLRTQEMHEENEFGIAAHWLYKEHGKPTANWSKQVKSTMQWVEQLKNWQEKYHTTDTDAEDLLSAMKIEFFKDRVFAITPRGDVIDLPAGSTPVDFAYNIHSEIGDSCIGAKVNGQHVPLSHELQSGDIVEVITQKGKNPSEAWLEFVRTSAAREHVRAAMRRKQSSLTQKRHMTKAELRISAEDRIGLLKDITAVIARSHVNIALMNASPVPGSKTLTDRVLIATSDKDKIEKIIAKLKKISGVRTVSYQLMP